MMSCPNDDFRHAAFEVMFLLSFFKTVVNRISNAGGNVNLVRSKLVWLRWPRYIIFHGPNFFSNMLHTGDNIFFVVWQIVEFFILLLCFLKIFLRLNKIYKNFVKVKRRWREPSTLTNLMSGRSL